LARELPAARAGDLLAVMTAGAYGAVQAGTYNSRPLIPEVLVNGSEHAIVRARPSYAETIGADRLPPWLSS
jgi:diaminopimelate decarboxylase